MLVFNTITNNIAVVNHANTSENYTFSNFTLGKTYYWTVMAFNNGKMKSYYSEPKSFIGNKEQKAN